MNEKIGIRNVAKIGIADIDVYNANRKKFEEIIPKNAVNARIRVGVFFDGTGNNADNSDMVYYYHKDKFRDNFPIDTTDVPKYKHKGFKVKSDSSYWNSYSNVRLLHDIYEEEYLMIIKKNQKILIITFNYECMFKALVPSKILKTIKRARVLAKATEALLLV